MCHPHVIVKTMPKYTQINALFPPELLARLRAESARSGCPLAELLRRGAVRELDARHTPGAPADGAPKA
jgi:hypothetical protein